MVSIRKIIIGMIRAIERRPLALSSTVPPASTYSRPAISS
jgi:hypothetical protein